MKEKPIIICGDWYDIAFANFVQKDKELYENYYSFLYVPYYCVSCTDENVEL